MLSEDLVVSFLPSHANPMPATQVPKEHAEHVQLLLCYLRSIWPWSLSDLRNLAVELCSRDDYLKWPRPNCFGKNFSFGPTAKYMSGLLLPALNYAYGLPDATPMDLWDILLTRQSPKKPLQPSIPFLLGDRRVSFVAFKSPLPQPTLPSFITSLSFDQKDIATAKLDINKQFLLLHNAIFPGHQLVILYAFDAKKSAVSVRDWEEILLLTAKTLMAHHNFTAQQASENLQVHSLTKLHNFKDLSSKSAKPLFYFGGLVNPIAMQTHVKKLLSAPPAGFHQLTPARIQHRGSAVQSRSSTAASLPLVTSSKQKAVKDLIHQPESYHEKYVAEVNDASFPLGLDFQSICPNGSLIVVLYCRTSSTPVAPLIQQIRTLARTIPPHRISQLRVVLESLSSHQVPWQDRLLFSRATDGLEGQVDTAVVVLTVNPDRLTRRTLDLEHIARSFTAIKARWFTLNLHDPEDPTCSIGWRELLTQQAQAPQEAASTAQSPQDAASTAQSPQDAASTAQSVLSTNYDSLLKAQLTLSRQLALLQGQYTRVFLHQVTILDRLTSSNDKTTLEFFAQLVDLHMKEHGQHTIVVLARTSPGHKETLTNLASNVKCFCFPQSLTKSKSCNLRSML